MSPADPVPSRACARPDQPCCRFLETGEPAGPKGVRVTHANLALIHRASGPVEGARPVTGGDSCTRSVTLAAAPDRLEQGVAEGAGRVLAPEVPPPTVARPVGEDWLRGGAAGQRLSVTRTRC